MFDRKAWQKEYNRKRYLEAKSNPEKWAKLIEQAHKWKKEHRKERLESDKRYRDKLRNDILIHYGGNPPTCACCGEQEIKFLGLDHINGNGTQERKRLRHFGDSLYAWLRKHDYPKGYQVLCHNCNLAKGFYGRCPHLNRISDD